MECLPGHKKRPALDSIVVFGLAALLSLVACDSGPRTRPGLEDATTGMDGGPTLCEAAAECATPENPCEVAACVGGVCASAVAPAGTFVRESAQVPGDCKEFICGESGTLTTRAATDDLPEGDGNPCTNAACDGPNPSHVPAEVGTPCGEVGVCNGAGACGECLPGASDCVGDVPRVCDEDGAWAAGSPCPFLCEGEGVCGGTCRPGTRSCNGRQPRLCDDAGEWTDDGGQCEFACSDGACTGSCVPGALQCSGNVPEACSEAGAWVQNEPCPFACQGGQCTGLCAPGAKRCQGLGAQSCGPTGQWTTTNDCPYLCIDGNCAGTCSPGAKRCVGRTSQECDGAGQWVDSQACDFACVSGNCTGICQPATTRCSDKVSQVCDSQGTWQTSETCTYACLGSGTCGGVCSPGATRCAGQNAETCDASGQWTSTSCEFTCLSGACTGICVPGSTRCSGNLSQTCNQSGQWTTDTTCPFVCTGAGTCSGECSPAALRCSGTTPQQCDASGSWSSLAPCTYACQNGVCTGVCSPGDTRCVGSSAQTCDSSGQWQTTESCMYVCAEGACSGECLPGTSRCESDTSSICDADGAWSQPESCEFVCREGVCTGVCQPGAKRCQESSVESCDPDGQWAATESCPELCLEGACEAFPWCDSETSVSCGDSLAQLSWKWMTYPTTSCTGSFVPASFQPAEASSNLSACSSALNVAGDGHQARIDLPRRVETCTGGVYRFEMVGRLASNYQIGLGFLVSFSNGQSIYADRWVWNSSRESAANVNVSNQDGQLVWSSETSGSTGGTAQAGRPWGWYIGNDTSWWRFTIEVNTLDDTVHATLYQPSLSTTTRTARFEVALPDHEVPETVSLFSWGNCDSGNRVKLNSAILDFKATPDLWGDP